ncbi:hypothetical protein ACFQRB_18995 [Halobaculum litoreum]|uniref:Uncharacterized protein n=1 Tax=Halobaculum litoreum TaxID=3031998 RepID=A0ABD5XS80_9EURY
MLARWDDVTAVRTVDPGTRAIAVVFTRPFGSEDALLRDVPQSSLSADRESIDRTSDGTGTSTPGESSE